MWGTGDDDYGDLRLVAASPCIDAGSNAAAVAAGLTVDLDGHGRFYNDPATQDCRWAPGTCGTAPIVDMGAYEYQPTAPLLGDLNCDGVVNVDDVVPFVLALVDPAGYQTAYPGCDLLRADMNGSGTADGADIQLFVDALLGG